VVTYRDAVLTLGDMVMAAPGRTLSGDDLQAALEAAMEMS
jgi:hypothetical protein